MINVNIVYEYGFFYPSNFNAFFSNLMQERGDSVFPIVLKGEGDGFDTRVDFGGLVKQQQSCFKTTAREFSGNHTNIDIAVIPRCPPGVGTEKQ